MVAFAAAALSAVVLASAAVPPSVQRNVALGRPSALRGGDILLQAASGRTDASSNLSAGVVLQLKRAAHKVKDTDGARQALNGMILEAHQKMDLEKLECGSFETQHGALMHKTRQEAETYDSQAAAAQGEILDAHHSVQFFERNLPEVREALQKHDFQCASDAESIQAELALLEKDMQTMTTVMGMTTCGAVLLDCGHHMTVVHRTARRHLEKLHSAPARHALQTMLREQVTPPRKRHHRAARGALLQRHRRHRHIARHAVASRQWPGEMMLPSEEPSACTINNSPSCGTIKDRFLQMQTSLADRVQGMKSQLEHHNAACDQSRLLFQGRVEDAQEQLGLHQARLANAVRTSDEAQEQVRLKGIQLKEQLEEWEKKKLECRSSIAAIQGELCGLRRIRQSLYSMDGQAAAFMQDCEVSDWSPRECSVSCGGGVQKLIRTVITPADQGATCPPLEVEQSCGQVACPVDCWEDEWSGWSACSAPCGGGVKQRVRHVGQEGLHGGTPCSATSEAMECNEHPCDHPCELADWTDWGGCSKACDGGFQRRYRHIHKPAAGTGGCPAEDSAGRLEFKHCNTEACHLGVKCNSKVDLLILVDGSASLGADGWEKVKTFTGSLLDAFPAGPELAHAAVLLYSGPSTYASYNLCISGQATDLATQCQVSWVGRLTEDIAGLKGLVTQMVWPQATSLTSTALALAGAEVANGRADAHSIVVVLTDGAPMSQTMAVDAARNLREKARLLFVTIGGEVSLDLINELVSTPVADNVLHATNFATLVKPETVDDVVASVCPAVV